MPDIKTKELKDKTIKDLDKSVVWTERIKNPIINTKDKINSINSNNEEISEYGENEIKYYTNKVKEETIYQARNNSIKATNKIKKEFQKRKIRNKNDNISKDIKSANKGIKNAKNTIKKTEKVAKETGKNTKRMVEQGRKLAIKTAKETVKATKAAIKITISTVKSIIAATKSLVAAIVAGGWIAVVIIIIICLVAALIGSAFGIFFSNEGKSRTMTSVVSQINTEVYKKAENQKFISQADDIIVESTYSNWKEVIAVYSVKYSNNKETNDSSIAMYLNEKNISKLRDIFYDFNTIKIDVRNEKVDEIVEDENDKKIDLNKGIQNPLQSTKTETKNKKIVYINVESKTLEQIIKQYNFNEEQKEQIKELLDKQYDELWLSLLYGSNAGVFVLWRQNNAPWSNIQIGSSGKNIGNIGCLVTSISILIEKSGANTTIIPFNPGTFVEALNKNGGFDEKGNLQYAAINKVVPNFEFVGRVELKGKLQNEKYNKIKEYQDKGYYLAIEVKGNTGQHWVAVLNVDNSITMADPGSDSISLWSTYNWENTSQFVYFKTK